MKNPEPTLLFLMHPGDFYHMTKSKGRSLDKKGRRLYEKTYGPIPKGFHVHHIDGDHSNNSLDNLMLIKGSDHQAYHNLKKLAEDIKEDWNNRPKWARPKILSSGPFVCNFNDDGSNKIVHKSAHNKEE